MHFLSGHVFATILLTPLKSYQHLRLLVHITTLDFFCGYKTILCMYVCFVADSLVSPTPQQKHQGPSPLASLDFPRFLPKLLQDLHLLLTHHTLEHPLPFYEPTRKFQDEHESHLGPQCRSQCCRVK